MVRDRSEATFLGSTRPAPARAATTTATAIRIARFMGCYPNRKAEQNQIGPGLQDVRKLGPVPGGECGRRTRLSLIFLTVSMISGVRKTNPQPTSSAPAAQPAPSRVGTGGGGAGDPAPATNPSTFDPAPA